MIENETTGQGDLLPARQCETQSVTSVITYAVTAKALEAYPDNFGEQTTLVPFDACTDLLAAVLARRANCVSQEAHAFAGRLVGFYPAREVTDARTYIAGMTALLSAYPEDFVKRVCDPVTGLPSQLKWLPTLAETKAALEVEKRKRDTIVARAQWTLAEHKRRRAQAEREASYLKTPEERQRVAETWEQAKKNLLKEIPSDPFRQKTPREHLVAPEIPQPGSQGEYPPQNS